MVDDRQPVTGRHGTGRLTDAEPCVVVLTGRRVGRVYHLKPKGTVIGRAADVDVVLDDDGISRVHAMIMLEDDRWVVRDLGSTNGTWVGERRVGEHPLLLAEGDRIRCGTDVLLRFGAQDHIERQFLDQLYRAATRDHLTGLVNRRLFIERLEAELAWHKRHDLPLSVMFIDIDHFKVVNDTFGHLWGDEVLKGVAAVLEASTRAEDIVARYGGEEFVVLLRHTDVGSAHALGERFLEDIHAHTFVLKGRKARVTASIGVATREGSELLDALDLLEEADSHLYTAKQEGRNRVVSSWIEE